MSCHLIEHPPIYLYKCNVAIPHLSIHWKVFMHSTSASTRPIEAQISLRCSDWGLFLGRRKRNTCFSTQTSELHANFSASLQRGFPSIATSLYSQLCNSCGQSWSLMSYRILLAFLLLLDPCGCQKYWARIHTHIICNLACGQHSVEFSHT